MIVDLLARSLTKEVKAMHNTMSLLDRSLCTKRRRSSAKRRWEIWGPYLPARIGLQYLACNTPIFNIILLIYLFNIIIIIISSSSVDCLTLLFFNYFYLN